MRRFFSWIHAAERFDSQWTGAAIVLRFMAQLLGQWRPDLENEEAAAPLPPGYFPRARPPALSRPHPPAPAPQADAELIQEAAAAAGEEDPDAEAEAGDADEPVAPGGGAAVDELRRLRAASKNALDVCAYLLSDRDLQLQMRSILLAAKPLMDEHTDTILRHRTQKDVVCWEAERAARAWLVPLHKVVQGLRDRDVLGRLRLSCGTAANLECPDALEALEAPAARRYLRLVLALLSCRSWSQCLHSETFPGMLAVAFHPQVEAAKMGMVKAARLRGALGQALDVVRQEPAANQALAACLRDVAYHEHALVQDLWSLADQAAWDRKDVRLRQLLWYVFSGPGNTKVHLEDVFNSARDECRRNPNKRVSRHVWAGGRAGRRAGMPEDPRAGGRAGVMMGARLLGAASPLPPRGRGLRAGGELTTRRATRRAWRASCRA